MKIFGLRIMKEEYFKKEKLRMEACGFEKAEIKIRSLTDQIKLSDSQLQSLLSEKQGLQNQIDAYSRKVREQTEADLVFTSLKIILKSLGLYRVMTENSKGLYELQKYQSNLQAQLSQMQGLGSFGAWAGLGTLGRK